LRKFKRARQLNTFGEAVRQLLREDAIAEQALERKAKP
jgi:hypothetical protein